MSSPSKLDAFFDIFGPLADTKPKRVALVLALAYITYRIIQSQFTQPAPNDKKPSPPQFPSIEPNQFQNNIDEKQPPSTQEYDTKEEKKESIMPEEIPRRYVEPKQVKGIPMSEEMLTIGNSGSKPINGNYRWFLHDKKWCYFTDKKDKHYVLESNIGVNRIYDILQSKNISFEWDKSVHICWIISDIDSEIIYYAAPQINSEYIPTDNQWIVIQGVAPTPQIFVNLVDKTDEPDVSETFGNAIPNDNEIKSVFTQLDVDHTGVIGKDKVIEGFKRLKYEIDNVSVLNIINEDDTLGENEFCVEFKKYASAKDQQKITFDAKEEEDDEDDEILERKENSENLSNENDGQSNGDNGVIVHQEDNGDEDEDDDSLSDLEA